MAEHHTPVLRDRVVALLSPALERPGSVVVDATVGLGGHAVAILDHCPATRLVGLDRDPRALELAAEQLRAHGERVTLVRAVFDELPAVLEDLRLSRVHGVLFDLGVSSLQLDSTSRGFAYARDAPLDMRMDPDSPRSAADILNTCPVDELTRVLRTYGEERYARRIADRIVAERARAPFTSSARLVEVIRRSIPAAARRVGGHPAKRTFQALRIAVNDELTGLARALPEAVDALAVHGRIVVLSYHSLEDRIAKQVLGAAARSDVPDNLPVVPPGHGPRLRLLTRGAEQADVSERETNRRSTSVRLRAAERIEVAA